ncbi:MAG: NAD-dependent succinate-semialdehyde dehydrogenase [Zoogloeaceae bacterium]|nr:NAD-dependent succinate-semialdehyde dehydrogenase [Zoogloeaceae bacterium]
MVFSTPSFSDFLVRPRCLINGQWTDADNDAVFDVCNPANQQKLTEVPNCGQTETLRAIEAARQALPRWSALTARERGRILRAWFERIMAVRKELAQVITAECGKPLREAEGEVFFGAVFIEWFAEEGKRAYGETIPGHAADKRLLVIRQPVGVCAAITPWNFPLAMITRKVAPALAAGCTVVLKPAEQTPLSALLLGKLAEEAGIPAGVLNIITGDAATIGQTLTENPVVRHLSFTGSTEVGRLLMAQCAPTLKRIALELGGNAPFIVFDDADLPAAITGALETKFLNTGQTCISANRFLVQAGIHDAFAEKLAEAVAKLTVGDGAKPDVQQGPLIDASAFAKVSAQVEDAVRLGAKVLTGGVPHSLGSPFYTPTVLTEVTPAMRIAQEETFGPVAPIFRFQTEEEAIALANASEHGLAAYFYSRDLARAIRVGEALEYGMVGINTGFIANEVAPFGGIKQSGMGREGSRHGLEEYLNLKYLCLST